MYILVVIAISGSHRLFLLLPIYLSNHLHSQIEVISLEPTNYHLSNLFWHKNLDYHKHEIYFLFAGKTFSGIQYKTLTFVPHIYIFTAMRWITLDDGMLTNMEAIIWATSIC